MYLKLIQLSVNETECTYSLQRSVYETVYTYNLYNSLYMRLVMSLIQLFVYETVYISYTMHTPLCMIVLLWLLFFLLLLLFYWLKNLRHDNAQNIYIIYSHIYSILIYLTRNLDTKEKAMMYIHFLLNFFFTKSLIYKAHTQQFVQYL